MILTSMNKWLELLLGLVLLLVPLTLVISDTWGLQMAVFSFIKGAVVVGVALIGLMFIMLGISDISS